MAILKVWNNTAGVWEEALATDDPTQFLLVDGTRGLSANWDAGSHEIRAETFYSDVTTGTAPLIIKSTTMVSSLNSDLWDSYHLVVTSLVTGDTLYYNGTTWANTAKSTYDSGADRWAISSADVRFTNIPSGAGVADIRIAADGDISYQVSNLASKQDIADWTGDSSGIFLLQPKTARYRDDVRKYEARAETFLCYIAEDTVQWLPEIVTLTENGSAFSIDYKLLVIPVIEELKKARRQLDQAMIDIEDLEARTLALEVA